MKIKQKKASKKNTLNKEGSYHYVLMADIIKAVIMI